VNKRVPDPEISKTKGGVNPRKPERERERRKRKKEKKKKPFFGFGDRGLLPLQLLPPFKKCLNF
jgi:hypothetical protein